MIKIDFYEVDPGVKNRLAGLNFKAERSTVSGMDHIEISASSLYVTPERDILITDGLSAYVIKDNEFNEMVI